MKIEIAKQDILDAVNKVKSVVSAKSALPILSHLLVESGEGSVRLSATDLKVSIECSVDCNVVKSGSLTVSSQRLGSILSELPDADITLELTDSNVINIDCGKIHTKLFSMAPDEFPPIRTFEDVEPLVLSQKVLLNILQKTSFAICTDQARYNLTGLLFELKDGVLTAVATDGRRMSLYREHEGIVDGIEIKVIIPGKMIRELERLLEDEGDVNIYISETSAAFEFGSIRLVTALIEGTFPNYDMVVPQKHDKEALLNTDIFTEAMRRTRTMTNEKFNSVRFRIQDGLAKLSVVTPEVGEYEEELPIEYSGDPIEIAFNPDFVLDVLKHISAESSLLVLKDSMSPGIIKPANNGTSDNYVNVVMPIRI
ncbi:MAG: DNA polymerase III subunit beta [Candidatus Hydrogenedentes bacterium]|nr:DNA polymerase III subunit beta [Candidatus Hydrogenedentota bacterium]